LREGHWKEDCRAYQKARTAARAAAKEKESNSDIEAAHFTSADDPTYSEDAYTATAYTAVCSDIEDSAQSEFDDEV
jgi:hypothetical protein